MEFLIHLAAKMLRLQKNPLENDKFCLVIYLYTANNQQGLENLIKFNAKLYCL